MGAKNARENAEYGHSSAYSCNPCDSMTGTVLILHPYASPALHTFHTTVGTGCSKFDGNGRSLC